MTTVAVQISQSNRPSDIPVQTWKRMQTILRALAKYLPDPFPSIRELSRRTQIPVPTVARLLVRAESAGLISRTPRVTDRGQNSYSYQLLGVSEGVSNETEKKRSSSTKKNSSSYGPPALQNPPARKTNRWTGACAVCAFPVQPRQGWLHGKLPVHQECDEGRPTVNKWEREHQMDLNPSNDGGDPTAALEGTVAPVKPAVQLARQFDAMWYEEVVTRYPNWRRSPSNRGVATGYLQRFFIDTGYSNEHVEEYFATFFAELADPHSTLDLRDGQMPFQLFTGWWGHQEVADPAIDRAKRERIAELTRLMEERMAVQQPLIDAARARIEALPEGEVGDPADYKLADWPMPVKRRWIV